MDGGSKPSPSGTLPSPQPGVVNPAVKHSPFGVLNPEGGGPSPSPPQTGVGNPAVKHLPPGVRNPEGGGPSPFPPQTGVGNPAVTHSPFGVVNPEGSASNKKKGKKKATSRAQLEKEVVTSGLDDIETETQRLHENSYFLTGRIGVSQCNV